MNAAKSAELDPRNREIDVFDYYTGPFQDEFEAMDEDEPDDVLEPYNNET